jgi:hypothetical protein
VSEVDMDEVRKEIAKVENESPEARATGSDDA